MMEHKSGTPGCFTWPRTWANIVIYIIDQVNIHPTLSLYTIYTASLLEVRHLLERGKRILCKQQVNLIDETNMR